MNNEILRIYYFKERVEAKKRWLKTRIRLKAKMQCGALGDMTLSRKSVIMKNNRMYTCEY